MEDIQGRQLLSGDKVAFCSSNRLLIGKFSHMTPSGKFAVSVSHGDVGVFMYYTSWGVVRI
jgi:hypothetical protein